MWGPMVKAKYQHGRLLKMLQTGLGTAAMHTRFQLPLTIEIMGTFKPKSFKILGMPKGVINRCSIRVIYGLHWNNGEENGSYYL